MMSESKKSANSLTAPLRQGTQRIVIGTDPRQATCTAHTTPSCLLLLDTSLQLPTTQDHRMPPPAPRFPPSPRQLDAQAEVVVGVAAKQRLVLARLARNRRPLPLSQLVV